MTGPLPSVTAMKKTLLTVVTAVAWFLPGHLAILALLVLIWGSAMATTANTAKARATEVRVNGVVTQLGVTNNNVTSAQNTASSAQSTANSANSTASSALSTANGKVSKSGDTITGDLTVNGNHTVYSALGVHGNATVLGSINGANIPSSAPGSAPAPPTGTGGASSYCGNFYSGSGAANWAQNISNSVDQVISALISAGLFS